MRKGILSALLLLLASYGFAQDNCLVRSSDYNSLELSFVASDKFRVDDFDLFGTLFSLVSLEGFDHSSEIGSPSLPTMRHLIDIPFCDGISVAIKEERHILLDGASIGVSRTLAPVQPSLCKTASRNANALVINDKVYSSDRFFGLDPVTVSVLGVARDRRLAQVVFSPVKYNPATNQFIVYTYVEAELSYINPDVDATQQMKRLHYSPLFGSGIHTINSLSSSNTKDQSPKFGITPTTPMRYLIVANSIFRGSFDEFVSWKKRTGFLVDVVYTGDAGVGTTQSSIKSYVKSLYTNATVESPAPTFILFVGDVAQIPAKSFSYSGDSHVSDLDYALWTSGDNLPDCYYGRFSAQTVSQLTPQIEKTLMYERYEFPDPSFLDKAILVAGVDGGSQGDHGYTHADPTMDYAAKFYVNGGSSYLSVLEYKNATSINMNASNVTVKSNSLATEIRSKYSEGAGWINYSAHGDWNEWSIPSFTNSNVASMSNTKKFGIMIGNCCLSGKFDESACFGETLLRKNNYCGAVGYIGGSNYTYWGEDVYWSVGIRTSISGSMTQQYIANKMGMYDRLFHNHGEAYSEWMTSLGAMVYAGNMSVQNSSSSLKSYYWQIYHVFGDPSLMPWLTQAKLMDISYTGMFLGSTSVNVSCAPYSYVALTDNENNLLGAAFSGSDGAASITCSTPLSEGSYVIAATAQNYQPKLSNVNVSLSDTVDDNPPQVDFSLFPNPTSGFVTVSVANTDGNVQYELVDITGRIIFSGEASAATPVSIDLSSMAKGTYFVRATASGLSSVKKLILVH